HTAMSYSFASDAVRTVLVPTELRSNTWRWCVALAVAIALHGAGVVWFTNFHDAFAPEAVKPPVQVALLTPQPIARNERSAAPRRHSAPRAERARGRQDGAQA